MIPRSVWWLLIIGAIAGAYISCTDVIKQVEEKQEYNDQQEVCRQNPEGPGCSGKQEKK